MAKSSKKNPDQLHLIVTGYWYDKIASGEKVEEYRSFSDFWVDRLCIFNDEGEIIDVKKFTSVKIHRGYTDTHVIFANPEIYIDTFEKEIPPGVEPGSTVFTITLPKMIFKS